MKPTPAAPAWAMYSAARLGGLSHDRLRRLSEVMSGTPYWTTFELPAIDMKAASVGILDQIVAGLRQWSLRKSRGGSRHGFGLGWWTCDTVA
jgi:hypothetical protein